MKRATVVLVCLALSLIVVSSALAATADDRPARIGVAEMSKVLEGYKEYLDSEKIYRDFLDERQSRLTERSGLRLLTADELKEYQSVKAVAAPTDAQKKRIEELKAEAEKRESELKGLQALTAPTDEQKKRTAELQALADKSATEIQAMQESMGKEIGDRNKELSEKLNKKIEAAFAAVAKDKRLDIILNRENVLYGGINVTTEVLAKLNGGS